MTINWINNKTVNFDNIQSLLKQSISTNQLTNNGPVLKELEKTLKSKLQISNDKSVICVSNGTVALWAAVAAIELQSNKNLVFATQSFTFPASAQGYLQNSIIVDIDKDGGLDLNLLDPSTIDGIIVTNVFGHLVDIQKYTNWCNTWNKYLIFDNAATSYSFYKENNCLNYGTASTISLHHTKPIGFGEGGVIIIDKIYEQSLRRIINFGIDNNCSNPRWSRLGSNYKMSDVAAAFCLEYFNNNFDDIVNSHIKFYNLFWDYAEKESLNLKKYPNFSDSSPFISCITFFTNKSSEIIEKAKSQGIVSRKYYNPLEILPRSCDFFDNIVCLPCHKDLNENDITNYINLIKNVLS